MSILKNFKEFFHIHYIVNAFLAVIFFFLKTIDPFCSYLFEDCQLQLREWELLTFMGCIIVMKNRKTPSYSIYFETVCMFAKMLSVFLFIRLNIIYAIIYALACFLHLIFLPQPVYQGPEDITYFRGPHMEHEMERDKRVIWLIEFYAAWAPNCSQFASDFAKLSHKYSIDNLKFGKMDVTRFPDIAKKFQIDTSSWTKQLPTVILFREGKEIRRRPQIDSKGFIVGKFIFCEENIIRDFQLTELYDDCKKNPINKKQKKLESSSNNLSNQNQLGAYHQKDE